MTNPTNSGSMESQNPALSSQAQGLPPAALPPSEAPSPTSGSVAPKPPREVAAGERWLLLLAFVVAVLCDRLIISPLSINYTPDFNFYTAMFWLFYLIGFYLLNWPKAKNNRLAWVVAGFAAALCIWHLLFAYGSFYGLITFLVLPCVLMAHAQYVAGDYTPKQMGYIVRGWFRGWFIKPFSAIGELFAVTTGTFGKKRGTGAKKVLLGFLAALPLLIIIVPLLGQADIVFGYYLEELLWNMDISSLLLHVVVVLIAFALFYSFYWNSRFAKRKEEAPFKAVRFDVVISSIALGTVLLVYVLFCLVQFTYLFAGAGLPAGMTYSEYARAGFAQIVMVSALNLLLFGVFLQCSGQEKVTRVLLAMLLVLSGIILVSGFVRLNLYIVTYGLTWLRLLSLWFLIYLAVVFVLCAVRLVKQQLPIVTACAVILLGWYTLLGYLSPDALIVRYNLAAAENPAVWIAENRYSLYPLSEDILPVIVEKGGREGIDYVLHYYTEDGEASTSHGLAGYRTRRLLRELRAGPDHP